MNEKICKVQYISCMNHQTWFLTSALKEPICLMSLSEVVFMCPTFQGKKCSKHYIFPGSVCPQQIHSLCMQRIMDSKGNTMWYGLTGIWDVGMCELEGGKGNVLFHPQKSKNTHFYQHSFSQVDWSLSSMRRK